MTMQPVGEIFQLYRKPCDSLAGHADSSWWKSTTSTLYMGNKCCIRLLKLQGASETKYIKIIGMHIIL